MTRNTSIARGLAVAALCLSSPAAAADLPKKGTYSGHYGWTFTGQVQKLGEDRVVYAGVVPGGHGRRWGQNLRRVEMRGCDACVSRH